MRDLEHLHKRVEKKPKKICKAFEEAVMSELGVSRHQAWTLSDWVRKAGNSAASCARVWARPTERTRGRRARCRAMAP